MTEYQEQKQAAIDLLKERFDGKEKILAEIDDRLLYYFADLCSDSSADTDDENDHHNVYELLGAAKFLRMLDTYTFNRKKVQTIIRLREGEWERDMSGRWHHLSGGLKCPGTSGAQVYRWQPFQVFVLASVFGFYTWVNTKNEAGTKAELLQTEREKDGYVWDYRRVCTDFTYFGPRKTDKTGLAAYIQFVFFFFEDDNSEIYCCANSSDQAKLLYSRTRQLIAQMDDGNRIRSTQTVTDWRQAYKSVHDSSVRPLSAGGKTKDGMFAQLCCADEYGSAAYTNGKSDMLSLVNVIQSSMGPRREPMTFTTTTAGTISAGPFIEKLDSLHRLLERELTGGTSFEDDRRLCLCLEPDEWEREEQVILSKPSLRKKVNPMLGIIVQHSSYDAWISEAAGDSTKMPELLAKYFNIYQTGRMTKWITGDRIRPMQVPKRITDCHYQDGWRVFVGLDFSLGDDLYAMVTLGVNYTPSDTMRGRFFADAVAWVLEKTMKESPNRPLYEEWVRQGWLYVCPGEVFDSMLSINQLAAIDDCQDIDIRFFGYDPAQSVQPINQLKAWLQTILQKKNPQATAADISNVIQQMVVPVSQTALTQNPRIAELESMILDKEPWIEFSMSPLWPWCFGNCAAEVSSSDLRRIVKGGPQPTHKIDLVHALLDALYGFDLAEGRVSE
ncbi:MAG: terminase large subunit domain-containing protein [Prevotella sp.]